MSVLLTRGPNAPNPSLDEPSRGLGALTIVSLQILPLSGNRAAFEIDCEVTQVSREALAVAREAAIAAGEFIRGIRESGDIGLSFKGARNLVTAADVGAEKIIIEKIRSRFPDHGILAEESAPTIVAADYQKPLWIIDPVDGTTNFAYGSPQVGISIAFADRGEVQAGVVAAPFHREEFTALRGEGAWMNDTRIHCSSAATLEETLVCTGFPYSRVDVAPLMRQFQTMLVHCADLRRYGACSLDLSWVACGRIDAYYESVASWDMAAGALIAREAGARVGQIVPKPSDSPIPDELYPRDMLVSSPGVFDQLLALLQNPVC